MAIWRHMGGPAWAVAAAILALVLAGTLGAAGPAAAQAERINPCAFSDSDAPCRVEAGHYRALIPQGYGPHPAVVYLYGSLGLSRQVINADLFQREVVDRGYALIVPAALDVTYRGGIRGTGWGRRARAGRHPRDDIAFIRSVLSDAKTRLNIDTTKLIFAGQSDGAIMIWELACHEPDIGVAFAPHAGSYGGPLPGACKKPVRLLHSHGRSDEVVRLEGEVEDDVIIYAPVEEALELMSRTNGCGRPPDRPSRDAGFDKEVWEGCRSGAALAYYEHAGGHDWPRNWLGEVIDWFEETSYRPATAVTRRSGAGATGFLKAGSSGFGEGASGGSGFGTSASRSGFQKAGSGFGGRAAAPRAPVEADRGGFITVPE